MLKEKRCCHTDAWEDMITLKKQHDNQRKTKREFLKKQMLKVFDCNSGFKPNL